MNPLPPPSDYDPSSFYRSAQPQPDWPIWREGRTLVFSQGVAFPMCCVKCGAPAQATVPTRPQWHNPWLYVLAVFPGVLIYAIIATVVSRRAAVDVPVCEAHRLRRRRAIVGAWALAIASFVLPFALLPLVLSGDALMGAQLLVLFGGLLAAIIIGVVGARLVTPTFIDARVVKLDGAGEAFLAKCPSMPLG